VRVGLLTTSFPQRRGDPCGVFVHGFAKALASRGHEVEVLAPEPATGVVPTFTDVSVEWVPYLRPRHLQRTFYGAGVPDNLRRQPGAWLGLAPFTVQLTRTAKRRAPRWDALVSHWALPSALAAAAARGPRPHLAVFHSADLFLLERLPLRQQLAQKIAAGTSSLLFVSPDHRARFLKLLPALARSEAAGRAHVCPMGVDPPGPGTEGRRALRKRLGFDRFTILSLGRLVPIKGLDQAIRAVAGQDAELVLAGEGPEQGALASLGRKTGARVRFVGLVSGDEKTDYLAAADAFVLPSRPEPNGRDEGVPTALLEALAAGLPVVASRTGGIPSIIEDEDNGLLVAPGDATALAEALRRLAADRNLRRRLARRGAKVGALYTWPELAPNLEALLRE